MSTLNKGDLGVAPLYLMQGRDPKQQIVILYLWNLFLRGEDFTIKRVGELSGVSIKGDVFETLADDGVLERVPEEDQKNAKPSSRYRVVAEFLPERVESERKGTSQRPAMPLWVFAACGIWKRSQGVLGPRLMHNFLKAAVQIEGVGITLKALERYARLSDKAFNPSPDKFVKNIKKWIVSEDDSPKARSFRDLLGEEKR